jgi:hypothetical protein
LYADLCNEQVFLRAIGRVSRSTWKTQWAEGIRQNLTGEHRLAEDWRALREATGDFAELRAFERLGWRDPWKWEPWWRRRLVRLGWLTLRVPRDDGVSVREGAVDPVQAAESQS